MPPVDVPPSAALVWDSAEVRPACDRAEQLRESVAVYLGRDAFEDDAPVIIRVRLRRAAGSSTLIADVSKTDADGQIAGVRSVSGGDTCETLDEALTLVVALLIDAGSSEQTPQTQATAPPEPSPPVAAPSTPAAVDNNDYGPISTAPEPERVEPEPGHLLLGAGVGTTFGLLAFPSFGLELQAALKPRGFWGIEVSVQAFGGASVDLSGGGALDFRLLAAGASLCPLDRLHEGTWLQGCGGVQLAWVWAESRDLTPPHHEIETVVIPTLHLQAARELFRGFYAGGGLSLLLPIAPNHYTFRDAQGATQEAFRMAMPSLAVGAFVAFPVLEL